MSGDQKTPEHIWINDTPNVVCGSFDIEPFDGSVEYIRADRIEQLEAKLIIAVAYIRRHIPDSVYEQRQQARSVLAELEGK